MIRYMTSDVPLNVVDGVRPYNPHNQYGDIDYAIETYIIIWESWNTSQML